MQKCCLQAKEAFFDSVCLSETEQFCSGLDADENFFVNPVTFPVAGRRMPLNMDLQAFNKRILPVQGRLFRLAQMFLRNREEAEDAIQDVFLRLWTNRQQLESYQSVEALAVQMTKNLCLDRLKSHHKQKTSHETDMGALQAADVSPYRQVENSDSAGLMHRLIGELPEQQKLVLHLRRCGGVYFGGDRRGDRVEQCEYPYDPLAGKAEVA